MLLTQAELDQSSSVLNRHSVTIRGEALSFFVHYWGGETRHYTNHVHKHSFFEVCYVLEGEGAYEEGGDSYPLRPGVLFLSRPHLKHQIVSEPGLYLIFLAFELLEAESSPLAIQKFQHMARTANFIVEGAAELPLIQIWTALLAQANSACPFIADTVACLSRALLAMFVSTFSDAHAPTGKHHASASASTLVHRAKLYIRDNLAEALRLSDVADYLHISQRHLSRLFADELGQTFTNYVRQERVRQAAILLTTTDWSIKRIATETGFDTVHYFTTVFKAEMGVPPGGFVKKMTHHRELFEAAQPKGSSLP